ncbi:hypothetical protein L1987_33687 [Smallanthus sonchifolius]|uniref:Uncharacterized protein n=1 Tax=Smallanthus sonchifolius TaxID=185202 RepID=A0ACB9HRG2_9ASTR|nr:hypothetical protein L1987_33687 [Smallanthus sonchifolius]
MDDIAESKQVEEAMRADIKFGRLMRSFISKHILNPEFQAKYGSQNQYVQFFSDDDPVLNAMMNVINGVGANQQTNATVIIDDLIVNMEDHSQNGNKTLDVTGMYYCDYISLPDGVHQEEVNGSFLSWDDDCGEEKIEVHYDVKFKQVDVQRDSLVLQSFVQEMHKLAQVPISVTEDYTCPFFHLKYASYKVFESHLRASHDLFNYDFWGEGDYQVVNVSGKITASSSERDVVGLQEQALKEAFEIFCSMGVAGSSSAELLATFCDNILKGGSEKLSDEAIEDTLEKRFDVCVEDETVNYLNRLDALKALVRVWLGSENEMFVANAEDSRAVLRKEKDKSVHALKVVRISEECNASFESGGT